MQQAIINKIMKNHVNVGSPTDFISKILEINFPNPIKTIPKG